MTDTRNEPTDRTGALAAGRHPVNVGHLVMGLAFLGLVGIWSLIVNDVVDDDEIRWLLPVPWVLAGLGGLAALAVSGSRRYATRATGWVTPPSTEPDQGHQGVQPDQMAEPEQADQPVEPVEPADPEPER
jgi:hypothetical protein